MGPGSEQGSQGQEKGLGLGPTGHSLQGEADVHRTNNSKVAPGTRRPVTEELEPQKDCVVGMGSNGSRFSCLWTGHCSEQGV